MFDDSPDALATPAPQLWLQALTDIPAVTPSQWQAASVVTRWLVMTRSSVLPLTVFSVLFAGCLAEPEGGRQWLLFGLTMIGLVLAHATNNLINDYVDHSSGLDDANYFRSRYGVHVLQSKLISRQLYLRYLVGTGMAAALAAVLVCLLSTAMVYGFALAGALLVLFYTYPLKRIGLGEVAVLLAWGPLMVGGTYVVVTGNLHADVWWAGLVYGLGPTVVIFAKHTDKAAQDQERGIVTLPTLLGAAAQPVLALLVLTQLVGIVVGAAYFHSYGLLLGLLAIPAALELGRRLQAGRPETPPADHPINAWPLWYTTHAFGYARLVGGLLVLGVLLQKVLR